MNNLGLIKVKFALECIGVEIGEPFNKLYRIDGCACDDIERLCIIKDAAGEFHTFFGDYSLGENFNLDVEKLFMSDEFSLQSVETVGLRRELWYYGTEPLFEYPLVQELGDTEETFDTFVIVIDGEVVAKTWSGRRNWISAESSTGVEKEHQRKGYASQTWSAWGASQLKNGKIAIRACRKHNEASRRHIENSGAVFIGDVLSFQ